MRKCKKRKYDIVKVKELFCDRNFTLLENEYLSYSAKMKFVCNNCGKQHSISLGKLLAGRGCKFCSQKANAERHRLSPNMVRKYFESQGCILLDEYVDSKTHLNYTCKCGNKSKILWSNFKIGKRCMKCAVLGRSGNKSALWNPNREQVKLNELLIKKSCKALSTCLKSTGKIKAFKISAMLGYTTEELRNHIINHPKWHEIKHDKWHLDHIFPIKAFVEHGITDLRLMNCLDNLQPLTEKENTSKSDSYDKNKFVKWMYDVYYKHLYEDLFVATEKAAIAASRYVGLGLKKESDGAAVKAIENHLSCFDFSCQIAIGEGAKDDSPMLKIGQVIGNINGALPIFDIGVDPIEGTTQTARGGTEAMSVMVIAPKGSLFSSNIFYMKKIAVGPQIAKSCISIDDDLFVLIDKIKQSTKKSNNQITFCILDRPRHNKLIEEVRKFGCRIYLINDCDVPATISTCIKNSNIDVYIGVGGTTEAVLSAAALKCMDGYFEGMLCDKDGNVLDGKIYKMNELVKGEVMFSATGITDGKLLKGVKFVGDDVETHSLLMNSIDKKIHWINTTRKIDF